MALSLLLPLTQGGIVTTSCTLVLTAVLRYYAIPLVQYHWSSKHPKKAKSPKLHKQMTSIGKFALLSQTNRNPSIISFFIALASKDEGMAVDEFQQLLMKIMTKHERLRFCVSESDNCFEESKKPLDEYTLELPHPQNPDEFKARVNQFLISPIDVTDKPWEVGISSGPIGATGAILNSEELIAQGYKSETVALFRVHHVLFDGVSCATIVKDLSDECDKLDEMMLDAVDKYKMYMKKMGALKKYFGYMVYYIFGTIYALSQQLWKMMTSSNPFDKFATKDPKGNSGRSVAWKYLGTIDEAKVVAKSATKHAKLNDLFVSLLSSALERQYADLQASSAEPASKCPSSVNVVIPVHLTGSILPGQSLGNKIGAFVAAVPFSGSPEKKENSSSSRLCKVAKTLATAKRTTAPLISWFLTSLISKLGIEAIAKDAIVRANGHAVAVLSNVQAFPFEIHWNHRQVKMMCPFLPLPPKVPIGVGVTSYDGKVILSVESADEQVVPDAAKFLTYMLEEYESLKLEIASRDKVSP